MSSRKDHLGIGTRTKDRKRLLLKRLAYLSQQETQDTDSPGSRDPSENEEIVRLKKMLEKIVVFDICDEKHESPQTILEAISPRGGLRNSRSNRSNRIDPVLSGHSLSDTVDHSLVVDHLKSIALKLLSFFYKFHLGDITDKIDNTLLW